MRRAAWCVAWGIGLAAAGCGGRQTVIEGTLLGGDGRPMPLAHVALEAPAGEGGPAVVEVARDGAFVLKTRATGLLRLALSGVGHEPERALVFVPEGGGKVAMDARLAVPRYAPDLDGAAVIGDFNGWDRERAVPLRPLPDGRLGAELGGIAGAEAAVQLVGATAKAEGINSTYPGPPVAPAPAARWVRRDDGRYAALVPAAGGAAALVVEPAMLLPRDVAPAVVQVRGQSETGTFAALAARLERERRAYTERRLALKAAGAGDEEVAAFVAAQDWEAFHAPVRELLAAASPELGRAAAVLALTEAGELAEMRHSPVDPAVARKVLAEVPPASPLWSAVPGAFQALTWADHHLRLDGYEAYLEQLLASHPDAELRRAVLAYDLSVAYFGGRMARAARDRDLLVAGFPDAPETASARKLMDADRVVAPGRTVPPFRVASLDDPAVVLTDEELRGRVYLIDFWAVWCGPCMGEMPHLHAAFERYRGRGFTIVSLSCDEAPATVQRFRGERWPMPWLHGFLDRCYDKRDANPLIQAFGVVGLPSAVLVGADGAILASGPELRGERLAATLAQAFGEADAVAARSGSSRAGSASSPAGAARRAAAAEHR